MTTNTTTHPAAAADLPEALRLAAIANSDGYITNIERRQIYVELHRLHALTAAAPAASSAAAQESSLVSLLEETLRPGAYGVGSTLAMRIEAALKTKHEAAKIYGWDCAGALVRTRNTMESYLADGVEPIPLYAAPTAPQAGAESYPPLPEPHSRVPADGGISDRYTPDQMRAYADATAALRARGAVPSGEQIAAAMAVNSAIHRITVGNTDGALAALKDAKRLLAAPAAPMSAQPSDAEPDLVWRGDDPEEGGFSPDEMADLIRDDMALLGDEDVVIVTCAKTLPNRKMRVWLEEDGEGDLVTRWEWFGSSSKSGPVIAQAPSDSEILALNSGEVHFSESPSKYPEVHGTQYHAGAPGILSFARAVLARWAAPQPPAAPGGLRPTLPEIKDMQNGPKQLNLNDRAFWVLGWNECRDAVRDAARAGKGQEGGAHV